MTIYSSTHLHTFVSNLVKSSYVMLKFSQDITWVAITNIQSLLASHLLTKGMLSLDVTIYSKYPCAYIWPSNFVKSLYVMIIFSQDITCVAITNIQSLLASHLLTKGMLSLDVTTYSSTPVHTFVSVTLSKVYM